MTTSTLSVRCAVHFQRRRFGRKEMAVGQAGRPVPIPVGRVPRISRLMALAIRFENLLATGVVTDYAELARLGHVSRARVTQIVNLAFLAPDIQEALLVLSPVEKGRDPIKEWQLRPIAAEPNWLRQRKMSKKLVSPTPHLVGE